jgi:peptidoglycan/LPS O-acetylase OafA/YrhL
LVSRPRPYHSDLPNLDLLRAFAVAFVFICHLDAFLESSGPWAHALGHLGVVFFFVHTCLVLLMSLERLERNGPGVAAGRFYVRRIFRIYPLYALCIIAVLAFHVPERPLVAYAPPRTIDTVLNLVLLQNLFGKGSVLSPLWSLPYEMQMYLVLPPLYYALRRVSWRWPVALGLFAGSVCIGHVLSERPLWAWYYVPSFLCGAIAYCLIQKRRSLLPAWLWPVLLAAIAAAYCLLRIPGFHNEALRADALAALAVGLAIPFYRQIANQAVIRVAHLIAKYSYGIYLSHLIALWLAFVVIPLPAWPLLRTTLAILITAALSVASYHAIEEPLIQAGKRVAERIGATARSEAVQAAAAF